MKRLPPVLVLSALLNFLATYGSAQTQGIGPLDEQRLAEAVKMGSIATPGLAFSMNSPLFLRFSELRAGNAEPHEFDDVPRTMRLALSNVVTAEKFIGEFPFQVTIRSPYTRVVAAIEEAKRKFQEADLAALDVLNAVGPQVVVTPGQNFTTIRDIDNVVIKRGTLVVKPSGAVKSEVTVQNRLGASKAVVGGTFTFEYSAFDPTAQIEIVLIGASENLVIPMTKRELQRLR